MRTRNGCALALLAGWLFAAGASAQEPSLLAETGQLADELDALKDDAVELYARYVETTGDDRVALWARLGRRGDEIRDKLEKLIENIDQLRATAQPVDRPLAVAEEILDIAFPLLREDIDRRGELVSEFLRRRSELSPEEHLAIEQEIAQEVLALDMLMSGYLKYCTFALNLGIDASEQLVFLDRLLLDHAASLDAHIGVAQDRLAVVRESVKGVEGSAAVQLRAEQRALEQRVHTASNSLTSVVDLMDSRGLDTTEYRQLLIRTTGNVTSDIFDSRVAFGLLDQGWNRFVDWLQANGVSLILKMFLFLIIVGIAKVLANIVQRIVARSVASPSQKVPMLLRDIAVSMSSRAVLLVGFLIALAQIGIELGPLLAGLGIAGFIVGFALQDTLSNFAAGVMILVYQPFDVGHVIEAAGVSGKVAKMSLVTTSITTFDNQVLIVPNGKIWGSVIRNKSAEPTRRVDLVFRVSHSEDIARAERILWEVVQSDERVLKEPATAIKVHELSEWSVDFIVRPWVRTEDYFAVYWDLTRAVKDRFDQEGIRHPVPRRDIEMRGEERLQSASSPGSTGD